MKKIIVIISLLVLISVLVSACGQTATTPDAPKPTQPPAEGEVATEPPSSEPKILRVRTTDDLVSMDPAFGVSVTDFFAVMPVYEGLIQQKPNEMDWELSLAESIELSAPGSPAGPNRPGRGNERAGAEGPESRPSAG